MLSDIKIIPIIQTEKMPCGYNVKGKKRKKKMILEFW